MKHAQPRGLNRRRVKKLLSQTESSGSAGARIGVLSRLFLGRPYTANPLIGSAETPEVFTVSLDGFDCVTYVETVLALSRASSPDEFFEWLRRIRYNGGRIEWKRRNHYMTRWITNNARLAAVRPILPRVLAVARERTLDAVSDLPPLRVRFKCFPKSSIRRLRSKLRTGDLIFFASTRKNLDVFHCGILVREGLRLHLRHSSRSCGGVVEQELDEFLKSNRMAGVIVVRPS